MWKNDYQYEAPRSFDVQDGQHTMVIRSVRDVVAKSGKQMIEIHYFIPSANGVEYIDRIVEGEYFNVNVSRIFDAFKIQRGDWDYSHWLNHQGQGIFAHKTDTFVDNQGVQRTVLKATLERYVTAQDQQNTPAQQTTAAQPQTSSGLANQAYNGNNGAQTPLF